MVSPTGNMLGVRLAFTVKPLPLTCKIVAYTYTCVARFLFFTAAARQAPLEGYAGFIFEVVGKCQGARDRSIGGLNMHEFP